MTTPVPNVLEGAAPAPGGCVWVTGPDAARFVHRLSTQHTEALAEGEARLNAFLNRKGRMRALCMHVAVASDRVALLTHGTPAQTLADDLGAFLFMEDAAISVDERPLQWVLGGRVSELAPFSAQVTGDAETLVARTFDVVDETGAAVPMALAMGLAEDFGTANASALAAATLRAGVPTYPAELNDSFNPLELELHRALHWDKGCFTGQEVISRIDNYDKQTRTLVLIAVGADVEPGAAVVSGEKTVGTVTRSGRLPETEGTVALAMVKKAALQSALTVEACPARVLPRHARQEPTA